MEDNLRLEGKNAVVTGAASGIGREIAILFAKHGANVALFDMDKDGLARMESKHKRSMKAFFLDITVEDEVSSAVAKTEAVFGKIDVLVNNAGIFTEGNATETEFNEWRKILSVNLDGAFLCAKYVIASMLENKRGGSIINIASECGLSAIKDQIAYNVSKAAIISMTKCMAIDYALDSIRVNCVSPGRVLTPLVQRIIDDSPNPEETLKILSSDRPMMQIGNPTDIAYACLHFADNSMPYATGAVLSVDGGYTI